MIPIFPKQLSHQAVTTYFFSLILVSTLFLSHAMSLKFVLIGIVFVLGFFLCSNALTTRYLNYESKKFIKQLFVTALLIRVVWVVFSYYFYLTQTGQPFEWAVGDAMAYHEQALGFSQSYSWSITHLKTYYKEWSYSDLGYNWYLATIYSIFGDSIVVTRLLKALISAYTCVLIYHLAKRNFGESVGRMSAIFCMLMPNLIYYCGLHLKETEMLFLTIAYLERADYLLRSQKYSVGNILLTLLLALSLFFFRNVLGAAAVMAFLTALLFTSSNIVGWGKKIMLFLWVLIAAGYLAGGTIMTEVGSTWEDKDSNQEAKRNYQVSKGVEWAKYATGAVMAPIIFVAPFSTMVDVDEQYNQQVLHGGNFVKNVLGIFVMLAMIYSLFINKNWRKFALIGSFAVAYLLVIAFSGFANSERFHLPALPCLLMMAAYGLSLVDDKNIKFVNYWLVLVVLMEFGWAFFKLGSRGLVG